MNDNGTKYGTPLWEDPRDDDPADCTTHATLTHVWASESEIHQENLRAELEGRYSL